MNKKKLKSDSKLLKPIINIGKNGLTDESIDHIKNILKKKKLIKIKLNKNIIESKSKKDIVIEIVEKTESELIDFIGFNIVLYKR